jgi:hypothetical protein
MIDLALDNLTGDISIVNGKFVTVTGDAEIAQRIQIHVGRLLGEWFLNTSVGIPWYEDRARGVNQGLLGSKDVKSIDLALRRELKKIYGVKTIRTMNLVQQGRNVSAYIEIDTIFSSALPVSVTQAV